ncbi:MAG: hypothetical protein H6581_19600 [Bacteroidia bacterium]|nr:hypothetical protein [Bacteroidia bacterium]
MKTPFQLPFPAVTYPLIVTLLLILPLKGLKAQVASSGCQAEIREYVKSLETTRLWQADSALKIDYQVTYCHRNNPADTVVSKRVAVVYKGQIHLSSSEQEVFADAKDGFIYYPDRYVIYRLAPARVEKRILEKFDPAVLETGIVTECKFTKATETTSNKFAHFQVSPEGVKKYKIREIDFLWSPLDSVLLTMTVYPVENQEWTYYRFDFLGRDAAWQDPDPSETAVGHIYGANGDLKARFTRDGTKVLDYR